MLTNKKVFEAIEAALIGLRRWRLLAGVVMPDHAHIITPVEERSLAISDFATGFKRLVRKALPKQTWDWQRGCFDRLLRSDENLREKWIYMEQNPIRAGLVPDVADWPYYLGGIVEREPVGEPVRFPKLKGGKLTASPTERS